MSQVLLKKKFTCSTHLNTYFSVRCVIFQSESKTTAGTISIIPRTFSLSKDQAMNFAFLESFAVAIATSRVKKWPKILSNTKDNSSLMQEREATF